MRTNWVHIPLASLLVLAATAGCGAASDGAAKPLWSEPVAASSGATPAAGEPSGTTETAGKGKTGKGKKSKKTVCKEAEAASQPFFDTVVNNAPTVQIGAPLPAEWVADVHAQAKTFAAELTDLAAQSRDAELRAAFDEYAAKVRKNLVDDADLSGLTPDNSGWLLSLGKYC